MRRSIVLSHSMAAVGILFAGTTTGALSASVLAPRPEASCTLPSGDASIVLSDTTPTPALRVHVGGQFVVTVPPWWSTHATDVTIGTKGVAVEDCTVLLADGSRRSVFTAMRPGATGLDATVAPASGLFMPAWSGMVTVAR